MRVPMKRYTKGKVAGLKWLIAIIALLGIGSVGMLLWSNFLVIDHPARSDVIVVLAGDHNDCRYWRGVELLRAGFGQQMVLDVPSGKLYGRFYADYAAEFLAQPAGDKKPRISLCTIENDSTVQESVDIAHCLAQASPGAQSALLVTSDFHTRRALSILSSRLPQYRWSAAASSDPSIFGSPWWRRREWAKTWFLEWQKFVFWELLESWRK